MRPSTVFMFVLGLALAARLVLALTWDGYWGVDGGASLLNVNYVLGDEPTRAGFPKPPLAPGFTLAPFVLALGADIGYKVWSALFSVLPLIPLYLLTRKYVGAVPAVFAAVFAAVDWTWGEMFVTGAHPLAAFALLGMAWYSMAEKAEGKGGIHDYVIFFSIGLIPWVNQTAAGLALIVLPAYFGALCLFRRQILWEVFRPCLFSGFLAIGAFPWYMQTLPGSDILTYDGPLIYWSWGINSIQGFLIALPLGVFMVWKCPDYRLKALGVLLLTFAALLPWMSYDEVLINPPYRSRYLLALAFYPCMAWVVFKVLMPKLAAYLWPKENTQGMGDPWVSLSGGPKTTFSIMAVVAFIYMSSVFIWVVREQASLSAMVTPETAHALEYVDGKTATNSFTLSLWVAGLKKVESPFLTTAPPPPAYVASDWSLRCVFGWVSDCNGVDEAEHLGVKYLLVEERFPHYNEYAPGNYLAPPDQWDVTRNAPWLELIYSEGTTRLYAVRDYSRPLLLGAR